MALVLLQNQWQLPAENFSCAETLHTPRVYSSSEQSWTSQLNFPEHKQFLYQHIQHIVYIGIQTSQPMLNLLFIEVFDKLV